MRVGVEQAMRVEPGADPDAIMPGRLDVPMWRSIAVFRVAALAYAAILVAANFDDYAHPLGGWIILTLMGAWTAVTTIRYLRPQWPLLGADLAVTLGCLIATRPVVGGVQLDRGTPIIPVAWLAGPVLAWAVAGRRSAGLVAGAVVGVAVVTVRGQVSQGALTALVVLTLTGAAVGYVSSLSATAEAIFQQATRLEAATRERERIARTIHDSVLQALAMIERRGIKLGGESAELARMAGEQGAALRALVAAGSASATHEPDVCDLVQVLGGYSSATVSLVGPADPIRVPARVAAELAHAVRSALDNVAAHCPPGTPAWVVVEDEGATIVVTVRDSGPGIPDGRVDEAEAVGRLGISQSIRGRVREFGGEVTISSAPGQGTEIEMRVPGAPR
jgi:signal transduction histidine kinase